METEAWALCRDRGTSVQVWLTYAGECAHFYNVEHWNTKSVGVM